MRILKGDWRLIEFLEGGGAGFILWIAVRR
jgi:hypothetical protein